MIYIVALHDSNEVLGSEHFLFLVWNSNSTYVPPITKQAGVTK